MAAIDLALAAIESLEPGEQFTYAEIAKRFGVNRSTLSRRHRGVTQSNDAALHDRQFLNTTQEERLVAYIEGLCERGLPPTLQMVRNFASEIGGRPAGKSWPSRFVERHKLKLISRWTTGMDATRHKADSAFKYTLYFELLKRKIEQYSIDSRHIYNMDEKGFLMGVLSKSKRLFSRRQYERGKVRHILQDGNREWITTIACICADGSALSPGLIYHSTSGKLQDSWLQDFDVTKHNAFFASSPSGWTNNEIGVSWLKDVFDRETKAKARQSYRLLILDGHGSHVTMDFIEFCDANKILLAIFPPHSTHTLQPLDVCVFGPLAGAYSAGLASFMESCQGLCRITKRDFFRLFWGAWISALTPLTILKAFEATGVAPFNPTRILARFNARREERPSSSESNTSILSASDWRKIERLLRQVVEDIYDAQAAKLSRTIHAISTDNQLLKHENIQLKEALLNERKRRQRGKALVLEAPEDYNGGAQFWSPAKVQRARDLQVQKAEAEKAVQLQKSAERKVKEQLKAQKQLLLEERRRQRAAAKEEREREREQKALKAQEKRQARAIDKQLRDELKASQKGNKRSLKRFTQTLEDIEVVQPKISPVEDGLPDASTSTRTRKIRLPKRFQ